MRQNILAVTDNKKNTILVYKALDAFEQDQITQISLGVRTKKLSKNKLQEFVNQRYPGGSQNVIRQAYSFGRKLLNGESLNKNNSLVTGENLLRLFKYIFNDLGAYEWPNVEKVIKESGPEYADLLQMKTVDVETHLQTIRSRRISELIATDIPIPDGLRQIAEEVEKMQAKISSQSEEVERSNETILAMSKKNTENEKKINQLRGIVERMENFLKTEQSPEKRKTIMEYIIKVKQNVEI